MDVLLEPVDLHWINGAADDPADFCLHGDVEFRIGGDVLLEPAGRDLTVSAAGLYLLRTLAAPHTRETPVGHQLLPCCGHFLYDTGGPDVGIIGCDSGEEFEVHHAAGGVVVRDAGRSWLVGWPQWRAAVFHFADRVSDFYAACSPKRPHADDAAAYLKFVAEWERRRGLPFGRR